MRFFNILTILAVASASEVSNLRGSDVEDRDLLSVGVVGGSSSYSKSASFSFNCCYSGQACFDAHAFCLAYAATDTATATSGNSVAESTFLANAYCDAVAEAYACSFACVKARGEINLNANSDRTNGMDFKLAMKLKSATLTVAKAQSSADVGTYTDVAGVVYTGTDSSFCSGGGKDDYQCNPGQAAAVAAVEAVSFGDASAMSDAAAASGTSSKIAAWVDAKGPSINEVSAYVTSVAYSWAFAAAQTSAYAESLSAAAALAIAGTCSQAYQNHCGGSKCGYKSEKEACDAAVAFGAGAGLSISAACANASAAAFADTKVVLNFGGTIKGFKNDGRGMSIDLPSGKDYAHGSAAAICPRK